MTENQPTKEKDIVVSEKKSKTFDSGKTVYSWVTDEGGRFDCWDKELDGKVGEGDTIKVRYTEKKNGEFTNRTVQAIKLFNAETGQFGEWLEQAKKDGGGKFGGRPFDSEGANKRTCLEAAARIIAAQVIQSKQPGTSDIHAATTLKVAAAFMAGLFKATPAPKAAAPAPKAAAPAPKAVAAEEAPIEDAESVPF